MSFVFFLASRVSCPTSHVQITVSEALSSCLATIMHYALCIMNYALKEAHGWDPITTTWFYRWPAFAFSFKLLAFSSAVRRVIRGFYCISL